MREKFSCGVGQINFDGKLMKGLEGYGKVNRLAVVLVQETENKLLCIAKMEQSTGSVEAEKIKEVLVEWGVAEKIIACGFDTTSSNTGVNKKINTGVSSKTLAVLNRHTWYLTEDLISLSLFNEDISLENRTLLAAQIHHKSSPAHINIRKPTLPAVTIKSELLDFVEPRSKLLFDLLEIPTDFLITAEWTQSAEYETAKQALKSLSTTNDSAERAIALAVNYNTKITRDEESYQELLQVVEYHRNTFGYRTKKDLKTFY